MHQLLTPLVLACRDSRRDTQSRWTSRSTCTRTCVQTPSPSLCISLVQDIHSRRAECVLPQLYHDRAAEPHQATDGDRTSEEGLAGLHTLFTIPTDEAKPLEGEIDQIGYGKLERSSSRLGQWVFGAVSGVLVPREYGDLFRAYDPDRNLKRSGSLARQRVSP